MRRLDEEVQLTGWFLTISNDSISSVWYIGDLSEIWKLYSNLVFEMNWTLIGKTTAFYAYSW